MNDEQHDSGRHPVNIGHLVMGVALLALVGVWALWQGDVVADDDVRWLMPVPWVLAGAVGLVASAVTGTRRHSVRQTGWVGEQTDADRPDDRVRDRGDAAMTDPTTQHTDQPVTQPTAPPTVPPASPNADQQYASSARVPRRLVRRTDDKMLGGVCSGLAAHFALDPTLVRILTVLVTVLGFGSVVIVYAVAWLIVPADTDPKVSGWSTAVMPPPPAAPPAAPPSA